MMKSHISRVSVQNVFEPLGHQIRLDLILSVIRLELEHNTINIHGYIRLQPFISHITHTQIIRKDFNFATSQDSMST